jgi:hypothetical protein
MAGTTSTSRTTSTRLFSRKDYFALVFLIVVIAIGQFIFFVKLTPKLLPAEVLHQSFYIVLLPWALICAIFLFAGLESYARVTYKDMNTGIRLGGPAAVFFLVLVGSWFVPRTDTFDLTIRPHGPGQPLITTGKIRVEFGNFGPVQDLNNNGEADFKGIAFKFWGTSVRILPIVTGYREEYQQVLIDKAAIDLNLQQAPAPETILRGRIVPIPQRSDILVFVQGEIKAESPDSKGRFAFTVHKKVDDLVRVTVCRDGKAVYDEYQRLREEELEIHIHRPNIACAL